MNLRDHTTDDASLAAAPAVMAPAPMPDVDRVYLPDPDSEPLSTAEALALTSTTTMPERPESPVAPVAAPAEPVEERPALPARSPGAAEAIADSAITGPAITRQPSKPTPYEHVDPAVRKEQGERLNRVIEQVQDHPLTSSDLAYRYPKEQAIGFNRGLRNAYAKGALSDLSDADLGLVTVGAADVYTAVVTELGYDPLG